MPADFLSYWRPEEATQLLEDDPLLDHIASNQYHRVRPGDTVWIVTTWPGRQLMLLGRVVVAECTDRAGAARRLGVGVDALRDREYHLLAVPGRAEASRHVDLADLAPALRFESDRSDRDRLRVVTGAVNPDQLQTMRRLTPAAAALLRERWGEDADLAGVLAALPGRGERAGGGYGDSESNRAVERAAVVLATTDLEADGWRVTSVEAERIGYDLHCVRGGEERHVEVKGARGTTPGFIMTEGEAARAEADSQFWLYLVTDALGPDPTLSRYPGAELFDAFRLVPLAYRAVRVARAGS